MEYNFKRATIADIDILTETRIEMLRETNGYDKEENMDDVRREVRAYYEKALPDDTHVAYLVFISREFVGCGGISFYQVMPTCINPTGKKAFIMNMYTRKPYRRKGIAMIVLDLLVKEAHRKQVREITLEAAEEGRPLYEAYGFRRGKNEMTFFE